MLTTVPSGHSVRRIEAKPADNMSAGNRAQNEPAPFCQLFHARAEKLFVFDTAAYQGFFTLTVIHVSTELSAVASKPGNAVL